MDILVIIFLMQVVGSAIGILLAVALVDRFNKWKDRRR